MASFPSSGERDTLCSERPGFCYVDWQLEIHRSIRNRYEELGWYLILKTLLGEWVKGARGCVSADMIFSICLTWLSKRYYSYCQLWKTFQYQIYQRVNWSMFDKISDSNSQWGFTRVHLFVYLLYYDLPLLVKSLWNFKVFKVWWTQVLQVSKQQIKHY